MKHILIIVLSIYCFSLTAQILNGSFENNSGPDLTNWLSTCNAVSHQIAPVGGGKWSVSVPPGNTQGCYPGFLYQKIPSAITGQPFVLSGWAYSLTFPTIGIYFGKINKGIITLLAGDTTSSTSWKLLKVQSTFNLNSGDTAIVVLSGGFTGGPEYILQSERYFDLIKLEQVSGTKDKPSASSIHIYPNPVSAETVIMSDRNFQNATIQIINANGKILKLEHHISGSTYNPRCENLPSGIYVIRITDEHQILFQKKLIVHYFD